MLPSPTVSHCPPPQGWGRILIVAAHPDDEVLGLGGHFRIVHPRIVHLTTGAGFLPLKNLEAQRALETRRALALGGIPLHRFNRGLVPDQGVSYAVPELVQKLIGLVRRVKADCLLTHAYEGGHPDHDAASVVTALAAKAVGLPVYEFAGYHNGAPDSQQGRLAYGSFLPGQPQGISIPLSRKQYLLKSRLLRCYQSQADFLRRFSIGRECFRRAPTYDYHQPPHEGTLLYESFGWPINYERWRESVGTAIGTTA